MKTAMTIGLAMVMMFASAGASLAADDAETASPRAGKYMIYVYARTAGSKYVTPLYNGYFVLAADGTYKAYLPGDKESGEGKFSYKAETHTVSWDTGPYAGVWEGAFSVTREGKTHTIRLKSNTSASNSTDSK